MWTRRITLTQNHHSSTQGKELKRKEKKKTTNLNHIENSRKSLDPYCTQTQGHPSLSCAFQLSCQQCQMHDNLPFSHSMAGVCVYRRAWIMQSKLCRIPCRIFSLFFDSVVFFLRLSVFFSCFFTCQFPCATITTTEKTTQNRTKRRTSRIYRSRPNRKLMKIFDKFNLQIMLKPSSERKTEDATQHTANASIWTKRFLSSSTSKKAFMISFTLIAVWEKQQQQQRTSI